MKNRAQTILEYTIVIGIVASALFVMQKYLQRGVQLSVKVAADELGEQTTGSLERDLIRGMKRGSIFVTETNINNRTVALRHFSPAYAANRDQLAVFLMRALGLTPYTGPQLFADVSSSNWAYSAIGAIYRAGITSGTGIDPQTGLPLYSPDEASSRTQVAVMLYRALDLKPYEGPQIYADVPPEHPAYNAINAIYQAGIMTGTSIDPPLFNPDGIVTRDQMAVILTRAFHLEPYVGLQVFADVDESNPAYDAINALYQAGLTVGTKFPEGRQRREINESRSTYGVSVFDRIRIEDEED